MKPSCSTCQGDDMTKTIKASEVRVGDEVSELVYPMQAIFRKPVMTRHPLKQRNGRYPLVLAADYLECGEDDEPTVYLTLTSDPGRAFCLRPDLDEVVIEGAS